MFLGKFTSLDGVYTYFIINSLRLKVYRDICDYFKEYNDHEYIYCLEYVGRGVYSLTSGFNILHFTSEKILDFQEVVDFLSSGEL